MAEAYKRSGAANPGTAYTSVYQVPSGGMAVVTVNICNRSGSEKTYRIAHIESAENDNPPDNNHFLAYDDGINATPKQITGISMGSLDKLIVYGSTTDVTFVACGVEVTS